MKDPVDGKSRSELVRIIRHTVEDTFSMANGDFDGNIRGTPSPLKRSAKELSAQKEV